MTTVITLAHQKGGVGKSTIALNLYGYLANAGIRAVLVDIDPQGTLTQFSELQDAQALPIIKRGDFSTYADLADKLAGYDVAVIDTPPYLTTDLQAVFRLTDLLIIPCKASLFDALAIRQTLEFVQSTRSETGRDFLSTIVLTMVIQGASITEPIRESLNQYGFPVLETEIYNRVAYVRSLLLSGNVVNDDTGKAREEMENLANELFSLINQKK